MSEIQWLNDAKELRTYIKAQKSGRVGVEFEPKELETEQEPSEPKEVVIPVETPMPEQEQAVESPKTTKKKAVKKDE